MTLLETDAYTDAAVNTNLVEQPRVPSIGSESAVRGWANYNLTWKLDLKRWCMGKTASLSILLVCLTQGGYILRPWAHPFTRTGTGLHGVVSGHLPHMMHSAPTMVAVRFVTQRRVISSRRTEWVGDQWAHERERPSSRLTSRQRHLQKPRDRNSFFALKNRKRAPQWHGLSEPLSRH